MVVALNEFATDTPAETALVREMCRSIGAETVCSRVWEQGSAGGVELAEKVIALTRQSHNFRFAYRADSTVEEKLLALTEKIYGGAEVRFTPQARRELEELEGLGFGELPVCVAKTQYSLSDDPKKTGAPEGFAVTVRSLRVSAGAGFVVALTGDVMTMPGLPKHPAAENIDITGDGRIMGLF